MSERTEKQFRVGEPFVVQVAPSEPPYAVVFEDDGQTGYFYALDTRREEDPILDAVHIYDVTSVSDSSREHLLTVVWADSTKAALVINDFAHAMFDFRTPRAMCVGNFPPAPVSETFAASHEWDEVAFRAAFPDIRSEWDWRQGGDG